MSVRRMLPAIGVSIALLACQVPPNLNEATAPTITITLRDKLGNQGWKNNPYVLPPPPSNGNPGFVDNLNPDMDILIAISGHDSGGMNTLTAGVSYYGNCMYSPQNVNATLTSINETAQHNPPNTVSDTLPFLYEVTSSLLKNTQAAQCPGERDGLGTIIVGARATNQAGHVTAVQYYLHMKGGVIPM